MNDDDLLKQAFDGVTPLQQDKVLLKKNQQNDASLAEKQAAAVSEGATLDPLASSAVVAVRPGDIVGFKRPGVQNGVYRKLRLGKYEQDARLDMHRLTVNEARTELYQFIKECLHYQLRTVMVLHGKGDRDPVKKATIKSHTLHWLEQIPEVIAYHSAQPHHGGAGALYVLLKKTPLARQQNRERHGLK